MNYNYRFMILAAIICSSFTAQAQQVHENMDTAPLKPFEDSPLKPFEDSPQETSSEEMQGSGPAGSVANEELQDDVACPRDNRMEPEGQIDSMDKCGGQSARGRAEEDSEDGSEAVEQPARDERRRESSREGVHRR